MPARNELSHSLETRRKIQASVKRRAAYKATLEASKDLREIDGIKLPRVRVGYKKPEPIVTNRGARPNFTPHNAKPVRLPNGMEFSSRSQAADYLGTNVTCLSRNIKAGTLAEFIESLKHEC